MVKGRDVVSDEEAYRESAKRKSDYEFIKRLTKRGIGKEAREWIGELTDEIKGWTADRCGGYWCSVLLAWRPQDSTPLVS